MGEEAPRMEGPTVDEGERDRGGSTRDGAVARGGRCSRRPGRRGRRPGRSGGRARMAARRPGSARDGTKRGGGTKGWDDEEKKNDLSLI